MALLGEFVNIKTGKLDANVPKKRSKPIFYLLTNQFRN